MRTGLLRVFSIAALSSLFLPSLAAQEPPPTPPPVVTVEPACPVLPVRWRGEEDKPKPVPVRIRYNPAASGARLRDPAGLKVFFGIDGANFADNEKSVALTREDDGAWQATVEFQTWWQYALFYFMDEQNQVDNNDGRYWEVLACGRDGTPTFRAVRFQAESYNGELIAPGIQRAPDLDRLVAILEADLERTPDGFTYLHSLWFYKAKREGETPEAYRKVAAEIEQFIEKHRDNLRALEAASTFVLGFQPRLPPQLPEKLLARITALNPKSRVVGEAAYFGAMREKDLERKIERLRAFAREFPEHYRAGAALGEVFDIEYRERKILEGVERAFQDWSRYDAENPDPYASLARFYIEQNLKLDEAVLLLNRAVELSQHSQQPVEGVRHVVTVGFDPETDLATLRYWRGRAYLRLGQFAQAAPDLEAAAKVLKDDDKVLAVLGETYERLGRQEEAFTAYLEAATFPYQSGPEAAQALKRVFIGGGMGNQEELEARVLARLQGRRQQAAADYAAVPLDRPAPPFQFVTLTGERLEASALRGRPVVLNFWSVWCAPCVPELTGFLELQQRHPEVLVAAIALDSKSEDVKAVLEKRNLALLRVALSQEMADAFGSRGVPNTFVLDANGRIRFVHAGALADVVAILEKDLAMLAALK